jgi:phage terminase large subunit-like protein
MSRSTTKPRKAAPRKRPTTRGERNIAWIESHCRVPEGKLIGQAVRLRNWQRAELVRIYDNPHGTRRAILSFGRKNGKTALSACILLLHLAGPEAEPNSQLFSAAQSREQAAVLFGLAAKMVRMSPALSEVVAVRDTAKQLYCGELGTLYRALSADAATAYGLSPILVIHDELGQVRGPRSELYEALETASAAHDNPMSIIISTQAPTDADLLSVLIDDALSGRDPRVVCRLYTAPESSDPFSEDAIRAANPAFGDFQNAREVLAMAEDARATPSRENEYRNLILNQRVEAHSPFISRAVWEACGDDVLEDWGDRPVYGGLDLSATTDLTALVLMCNVGGVWQVRPTFWLPEQGLKERAHNDRVPYDVWAKQGFLETTPGPAIEYEWVAERLKQLFQLNIQKIAFDRWGFKFLKPWLLKAALSERQVECFAEFGQGFASMSPALRDLETLILQRKMAHGKHPVLTMCASNAVVQADPAGNRKLNKAKSTGRIDGMVALAMAAGVAVLEDEAPAPLSVWEQLASMSQEEREKML